MSLLFNSFQIVREYLDIQLNIKPIISKNIKYKNIHASKRCFIIGNGSSLKQMDLSILKNEITFGMNAFWKHPIISKSWQPKYYCLADPLFFDDHSDSFNSIKEFFTGLGEKIYTSILFVPLSGKDVVEKYKLLPINKVNFIFFNKALWTEQTNTVDLTFSEDLNGSTVTNRDFTVIGHTLTLPDASEITPGVVRLTISDTFAIVETPEIVYNTTVSNGVKDLAGNVAPGKTIVSTSGI